MIGSLLTRGLVMIFGYAYPAYECFKTIELNEPEIEQLRFWCQYWILVAMLTVCERIGDTFISWVPMYSEAKLAFFLYLWCPKTKGTTYVYDCFFKPVVANHEAEIDRSLQELRCKAEDLAVLSWQRSASYIQTRIFDILQYIASQSAASRPAQPQQQGGRVCQPPAPPNGKPAATKQNQGDMEEEEVPSQPPTEDPPAASVNAQKTTVTQALVETTKTLNSNEVEVIQIDSMSSSADGEAKVPPPETKIEEVVRVTRARTRKTRAAPNR